jgi:transposase
VECYLEVMATLNAVIGKLSLQLRHLANDDEDIELLMTIPGMGYYTSLLVKAEVGDVNRFSTGEQVARVAAARKLLMCCWAILKSGQPYHDQASVTPR